jgi:hypothetical protein
MTFSIVKLLIRVKNIFKIKLENALAVFILSEIHQGRNSIFFNFFRNLNFHKIPILYEYRSLEIFKEHIFFNQTLAKSDYYKKNYKDLRRLVFSHGEEIKTDFIGSFLFGDYLWAM